MSLTGMDIDAVRQLGGQLRAKADEIRQISSTLTGQLGNVQWLGQDADAFRNDWQSQHVAALNQVAASLEAAGQRADANANQQAEASQAV